MSFSPTDSTIFGLLFSDEHVATAFSDAAYIHTMIDIEVALAVVQERLGVIPAGSATAIRAAAATMAVDFDELRAGTEKAGFPIIALVKQLRAAVGSEFGSYVHYGATTQDIMDTGRVIQLRTALTTIEATLDRVIANLAELADTHRHTVLAGRTHGQQALPTTFGLKVAGWLAPLLRHRARLAELKPRLFVVQFGGAAGTLAALGAQGFAVQEALAVELELDLPTLPWHSQRDTFAELGGWLSLLTGSLAKTGQDIILMAHTEVGELRESGDRGRGGSSTMPQKSNPIVSELIIAAARTNAGLLSSLHQAMVQEHERGTHGWQVEWLTLPQMVSLTAAAVNKAHFLSEQLDVNVGRMADNIAQSKGLMMGEAISFALADHLSRAEAKQVVADAVGVVISSDRHLVDVVAEMTGLQLDWESLKDEASYVGAADTFIERVLALV